jgi:hypothetical protein
MTINLKNTASNTIGEAMPKEDITWHELDYLTTEGKWATAYFCEIPTTTGAYAITADGVVVSLFWTVKAQGNPIERKQFPTYEGYLMVDYANSDESRSSRKYVHRLVAEALLTPPANMTRTDVNHLDGQPSNNHVGNLSWMTRSENMNWNKAIKRIKEEKARVKASQL